MGHGKKHFRCFQPGRFRGMGKNTADVSSPDLGERQTRSRFFLSPWTPSLFHAEVRAGWVGPDYRSVRWLGSFRLRLLRPCSAGKTSAEHRLSARSRLIRPQILWASARPLPSGSFASRCALGAQRLAWHPIRRCGAGWGTFSAQPIGRCGARWGNLPPTRCRVIVPGGDNRCPAELAG